MVFAYSPERESIRDSVARVCAGFDDAGGTNIYPREVEEVLARHPGVLEVSVIGQPSAEWGEDVVAFIVVRPGRDCSAEALEAFCRAELASFKKPRRYFFSNELPKNSYGRCSKRNCDAWCL